MKFANFIMLYTGDFALRYYVGFLQIRSHMHVDLYVYMCVSCIAIWREIFGGLNFWKFAAHRYFIHKFLKSKNIWKYIFLEFPKISCKKFSAIRYVSST